MEPADHIASPGVVIASVLDDVTLTRADGVVVLVGSLQQKLFLTLLVAFRNRSVPADRVAEELWGEYPPRRWQAAIRTLACSLRTLAGDRRLVHWTGRGYRLHAEDACVDTDVDLIVRLVGQARAALAGGCADEAEQAAKRALTAYGTGPWTTDLWHWGDVAAEAYAILGQALLAGRRPLSCLVELAQVPEELAWHDGVRRCLEQARTAVRGASTGGPSSPPAGSLDAA